MNELRPSTRSIFVLGFVVCCGLFITALYFQFAKGLDPCPLCDLQRIVVIFLGFVMLLAAAHNPAKVGTRVYSFLILLFALAGLSIAGRQVWLQMYPAHQISSCGAGLTYMLKTIPFNQTLALVFQGSGECDRVQWTFLGLSMAGWMTVFFAGFSLMALWQFVRARRI